MKYIALIFLTFTFSYSSCQEAQKRDYRIVDKFDAILGFEDSNYKNKLKEFTKENKIVFERFKESAEEIFAHSKNEFKFWHDSTYSSFQIDFNGCGWECDVRCNVHFAGKVGFETISPNLMIRDNQLNLDYCIFYGSIETIGEDKLMKLLQNTFAPLDFEL